MFSILTPMAKVDTLYWRVAKFENTYTVITAYFTYIHLFSFIENLLIRQVVRCAACLFLLHFLLKTAFLATAKLI